MLAEYLTGGLDPRRLRVLAARVVAVGQMLDGAGFLEIFESLRTDHRIPARTAWSIAIRVVVGGGSVKDAIYLRGITRILDALAEGSSLEVLLRRQARAGPHPADPGPARPRGAPRTVGPSTLAGRARRSGASGEAARRARRSPTCTKEAWRHEDRLRGQRRRDRGGRVHDHAAGEGRGPWRARDLVRRGRRRRARESDGSFVARARMPQSARRDDTLESFMERIKARDAERIVMDDLDAVFLRNESIDDLQERPWASPLGRGLRPDAQGSRRDRGQRPDVPAPRHEQALPRGVPREDPTAIARDPRPGSDRAVRRRGRPLRRQAVCTAPRAATCS